MGVRSRCPRLGLFLIALVLPAPSASSGPAPGADRASAPKTFEATLAAWGMTPRPHRLAFASDKVCSASAHTRNSPRGNCAAGASAPAGIATPSVPDTIFANGFDNAGGQCLTTTDCPVSANECTEATCYAGFCDATALPSGIPCTGGFCDGFGACKQCLSAGDCPTPGNDCFEATCDAGSCRATALPYGSVCSGGFCDGIGNCEECLTDNDCPATGNDCVLAVCTTGSCGTEFAPADAPCDSGTGVCDGMGSCQPLQP